MPSALAPKSRHPIQPPRRLAGTFAAVTAARIFSLGAAAAQLPLLTHSLSPSQFAFVAAAIASGTYVSLAAAEAPTLGFQRFPGALADRKNYRYARRRLMIASLVTAVIALAVSAVFHHESVAIAAIGWGLGLGSMRFISTAWLMWDAPWRYASTLMASTGVRTALLLITVTAGFDVNYAVALAGLASAAVGVLLGPRARGAALIARPWPKYFGLSLALGSAGVSVITNLDQLLLPRLTKASAAGRYAAMASLAGLSLAALVSLMATVFFPQVLRHWNEDRRDVAISYMHRTQMGVSLLTAACLVAVAVGEHALQKVIGREYVDLQIALCLLASAGLFGIGQQLSWRHNLELRHVRIRNATLLASGCNVVLFFALVPVWSVRGAALATAVGFFVFGIAMLRDCWCAWPVPFALVGLFALAIAGLELPTGWTTAIALAYAMVIAGNLFYERRQGSIAEGASP